MQWTIGRKLTATFAVVFVVTMLNAVVVYERVSRVRARQLDIAEARIPAILAIDDIRIADQRLINGLYGSIFLQSDAAALDVNRKQIAQSQQRVEADLDKLRQLSARFHSQEYDKHLANVGEAFGNLTRVAGAIGRESEGKSSLSRQAGLLLTTEAIPTANKIRDVSKDWISSVNQVTDADNAALAADGRVIALMLIICTTTLVVVGGYASRRITRGIILPLRAVVDRAESIADGDLTGQPLATTTNDELASLTTAVNKMHNSLAGTLESVASAAGQVASASAEISANAGQTAAGAQTQKDQVNQIAAAMQQMSATVQEVSKGSNRAADLARTASETARDGGAIVEDTLLCMRALAKFVNETASKVRELGSRSDQIGKIIGVIDDIADQTNLLALNAAIEAARAGEQGRGFAVVADEVRKLAERTSKATKEIADMIQGIQHETRTAVEKMQFGTTQVEKGVEATNRAGESLKRIISQAAGVGDMIAQIATAATEQSAAAQQVSVNMEQISHLVTESSNGAQQSAGACEQLTGSATEMQNLVLRFKLDGSAHSLHAVGQLSDAPVASATRAAAGGIS